MHEEYFVDQIRVLAALDASPAAARVLSAFRNVPREAFAGPGPWKLQSPLAGFTLPMWRTPDADPRWLYHCVLIVLDEEKDINIGDPCLWARNFAQADIRPGARVLQVGVGVGYYTAILSHLVGPDGHVTAYEVEASLAQKAAANLKNHHNVTLRRGNAATDLDGDAMFDVIVSFAGVTHIPPLWASHLSKDACLLLPLTGTDWWGAMIIAQRSEEGFEAKTLGRCGFYPCAGARDEDLAAQVTDLFSDPQHLTDWRFRIIEAGGSVRFESDEK